MSQYHEHIDFFRQKQLEYPDTGLPDVIGYEPFHAAHRAVLLARNPDWYGKYGWTDKTPQKLIWSLI